MTSPHHAAYLAAIEDADIEVKARPARRDKGLVDIRSCGRCFAEWGPEFTRCPTCIGLIRSAVAIGYSAGRRDGRREGYQTARGGLVSGAFIGGPTYEALRDSFTGQRIAKEARRDALTEAAAAIIEPAYEPRDLLIRESMLSRAVSIALGRAAGRVRSLLTTKETDNDATD